MNHRLFPVNFDQLKKKQKKKNYRTIEKKNMLVHFEEKRDEASLDVAGHIWPHSTDSNFSNYLYAKNLIHYFLPKILMIKESCKSDRAKAHFSR